MNSPKPSSVLKGLRELDTHLFRRALRTNRPAVDRPLLVLTKAADKSMIWLLIAGFMAATGSRNAKRAAARGVFSIALTSFIVNLPAKMIARRKRPRLGMVPRHRRLVRRPTSYSFPSGHAASAAAFATGVTLEHPVAALPIAPVAAAVAYSRVHWGVHFPGDVLAGAAIGAGMAVATKRIWPVEGESEGQGPVAQRIGAPAAPEGRGVTILVNPSAGPLLSANPAEELRSALPKAKIVETEQPSDLKEELEGLAKGASAIGMAGGDGSVGTGAAVALKKKKRYVLVPAGTLNHLARDLGISSTKDVIGAIHDGDTIGIDTAIIDGRTFCNVASLGSYVELVDLRERLESKIGKWPAGMVALFQVLRKSAPIPLEIEGEVHRVWMVFIGNCRYVPSGFAPSHRMRMDDGVLDVRIFDAGHKWSRARLAFAAATGNLTKNRLYEQRLVDKLTIRSLDGPLRLACDGETFDGPEKIEIKKAGKPLEVYAPTR